MQRIFLIIGLLVLGYGILSAQTSRNQFTWDNIGTEKGLVHPRVNALVKDKKGFLWIGTFMGLNRFDGKLFKVYHHSDEDPNSLSDDYIRCLHVDSQNTLWIGTDKGIINRFVPESESFLRYDAGKEAGFKRGIKTISSDGKGNLWLACVEGILKLNPETGEVKSYRNPAFPGTSGTLETMYIDVLGRFWVGFWEGGLFLFDPVKEEFTRFFNNPDAPELLRLSPMAFREDSQHNLWIGSYNLGLIKISHPGQKVSVYSHDKNNIRSINSNKIKSLEIQNDDRIWIGTEEAGLDLFIPSDNHFIHLFSGFQSDRSVEGESIYAICRDEDDRLWLGSRENGIYYMNAFENPFLHIDQLSGNSDRDAGLTVTSLCEDSSGHVWAGIHGDLALVDFTNALLIPQKLNLSETPNVVSCDPEGNIWTGGLKGGIYRFNPRLKQVKAYRFAEIENMKVNALHFDKSGVYIGIEGKFGRFDPTEGHFEFINKPNIRGPFLILTEGTTHYYFDRQAISVFDGDYNTVYQPLATVDFLFPNSKCGTSTPDFLYCGTDAGLFSIKKKDLSVTYLDKLPGPISYSVKSVLADDSGNIWFSTNGNIVRYVPENGSIRIFDYFDGLPQVAYRDATGCKTSDGKMVMGGKNGIVVFSPESIRQSRKNNVVEISSIVLGRKNQPGHRIPAYSFMAERKTVDLKFNQNFFAINWSMPQFIQPEKVLYSWKLEGFDKDWSMVYNERSASFMNLPRGEYTFLIRAKDTENNWSESQVLRIRIHPPWWLTWYAYSFYFVVFILSLFLFRNFNIRKERLRNELDLEKLKMENIRQLIDKEHELNESKFRFFTNVSHEFKTPLTLIISPLVQYIESGRELTDALVRQIYGNAGRLYQLITQILDFRKMEDGKLVMNYSFDNIVQFAVTICSRFRELASQKGLAFEVIAHNDPIFTRFDADKVEKIIYNLLSNAFKFTSGGKIKLEISRLMKEETDWVEFIVEDSGIGIPAEELPRIFERFYQVKSAGRQTEGTGIGLSLVQELVKLHGGTIRVESEAGKGTTFVVMIPVLASDIVSAYPDAEGEGIEIETASEYEKERTPAKFSILIAEDNPEMRNYLARELQNDYEIIEAEDGESALDKCMKFHPDLVLCDILMPGTDGLEFCRRLKEDEKISHIPVLLVTALSSPEYQEKAYRLGADDYITKPFKISILKEKIHNFISSREALKKQFVQNAFSEPSILKIASNDEKFLLKSHEVIEENLSDSDFDIDRFASAMATSRSQLYRKLKALTGLSASEYMKITRLKIAARMITEKNFNISEAAYLVGFKDPKYFSKCFQKQFGVIPSRYKQEAAKPKVES